MESCVVCCFSLLDNCDKESADIFYLPGYTQYTFHIILVLVSTVIKNCIEVFMSSILWSIYILSCLPNKIVHNYFKVSTIIINYFSITVYHFFSPVSLQMQNAMDLPFWITTAPSWKLLAYVSLSKFH